jgi:hypothetical protein
MVYVDGLCEPEVCGGGLRLGSAASSTTRLYLYHTSELQEPALLLMRLELLYYCLLYY